VRRRSFHAAHGVGRVNVTPMIDVVMVLIVFYLIVGKLASERIESMELPRSAFGDETPPPDPLVINVLPGEDEPRIVVETFEVSVGALEKAVRERLRARDGIGVQIRASRTLPYGAVRPVLEACRRGGARTVLLSTERSS